MSKMFRCDNDTMFSIDEVLLIKETATYCTKEGYKVKPVKIYSSEKELLDAIPTVVRWPHSTSLLHKLASGLEFLISEVVLGVPVWLCLILGSFLIWLILWIICIPFRLLFGTKFPGPYSRSFIYPFMSKEDSKKEMKRQKEERRRNEAKAPDLCREDYYKYGCFWDSNSYCYTVKQWDVTLKNQRKKIHIFNSDYERLRAEMVK